MVMADTSTVAEEGVMVGGALMVPSKNIVENAMGSSEHTTLVAAVKAAGLAETLSGTGPFTVFAPTNAAFDKLPAGTVDNLLKPEMKNDLTKVLTYHVVSGSYKSTDLKDGMELTTVQGGKIKLAQKDGAWWVNGAKITTADVISSNGATYVIDSVLMPK
ncbi:fasciclin domain-containing protein [Pedobacter psychroterrae]